MPNVTPLDIVLLAVVVVALPVMSAISGRSLARTPRTDLNLVPRYTLIIVRSVVLAGLVLLTQSLAARPYATLGLDIPVGARGRFGFALDVLIVCVYTWQVMRPKSAERRASVQARLERMRLLPQTRGEFLLYPVLAIVGSAAEELLYRGWLIWFLAPVAGLWGAVVVSSLVFGLAHAYQGAPHVARTSIIGLAFGSAYALTQSLWWLMVAHVAVNMFGVFVARSVMPQSSASA